MFGFRMEWLKKANVRHVGIILVLSMILSIVFGGDQAGVWHATFGALVGSAWFLEAHGIRSTRSFFLVGPERDLEAQCQANLTWLGISSLVIGLASWYFAYPSGV